MRNKGLAALLLLPIAAPVPALAQMSDMQHQMQHQPGMQHGMAQDGAAPREPGQAAFAAIAEIVEILRADPQTDWSKVDIEALRRHLADMDNVTLHARVAARQVEGGAAFEATSPDPEVAASIGRMVTAHAATMSGVDGIEMRAEPVASGARLTATGPDPEMIRGLGFIGLMALGMHHQAHHFALARGGSPHAE